MPRLSTAAALAAMFVFGTPTAAQHVLLMVKPGDPAATEKRAAAFLERLRSYCGDHVAPFATDGAATRIANSEKQALAVLASERPVVVLAPFPFYLEHLRSGAYAGHVVAQVPRFGTDVERFHVVVRAEGGAKTLAGLAGKRVHTAASMDPVYLRRVVFPATARPGVHFELHTSKNISDDVFLMTEGGAEPGEVVPDALIVDEELKRFLAADEMVWPSLRVAWTSPPLPRDVVVALGDRWDEEARAALLRELAAMKDDDVGREILTLMRSKGIAAPNRELIGRTAKAFDRTASRSRPAKDQPESGPKKKRSDAR